MLLGSLESMRTAPVNQPAVAGESIKLTVERSGTMGGDDVKIFEACETVDSDLRVALCRPLRGLTIINRSDPGFRFAAPWALRFHLLRRFIEDFHPDWLQSHHRDNSSEKSGRRIVSLRLLATLFLFVSFALFVGAVTPTVAQTKPDKDYLFYVVSEAADKISLVRFGPNGARVEREIPTGDMPVDIDGPHGIVVARDKDFYYVSLAHGRPFGSVWKYSVKDDRVVGRTTLGLFPATMDLSPDGSLLYVVNFNLHGDMVPSSVSLVATEPMLEVTRIQTCTMPHGSRLNPQGTKHYSACMMDDMLVEIDTQTLKVSRHFLLTKGHEMGMNGPPSMQETSKSPMAGMKAGAQASAAAPAKPMDMGGHGIEPPKPGDVSCSPTWAQPSIDGSAIFVACNKSSEIVEVDAAKWEVRRRIPARAGVYNLAITKDGTRLLGTNKRDQSVSVIDLKSGRELARIPTRRKVLHGVVVSPDDRYAFVSVEGVGSEPGTVEIIDLAALRIVASLDVPEEAAGIDFLRTEPVK
jgi:DNA-binding beta-propeller fold protein YncE